MEHLEKTIKKSLEKHVHAPRGIFVICPYKGYSASPNKLSCCTLSGVSFTLNA